LPRPATTTDQAPPARNRKVTPVAREAAENAKAALLRSGFRDPTLVLSWSRIAGPETAALTRPLRLSEGAHGGVLTLLAEPGAALFLQHESRSLCERINTFLGGPVVTRLKFVQASLARTQSAPQAPKPPAEVPQGDPVLAYKGPDALREALCRLARARHSAPR